MATDKTASLPQQFAWDQELQRIAFYKEDLGKGGWNIVKHVPGAKYHMKNFAKDSIPTKITFEWKLPVPGNVIFDAYRKLDERYKWDSAFSVEVLERTSEGAQIFHLPGKMPWPFADREWVFSMGDKEFPSEKSWLVNLRTTTHPSKPIRSDVVRFQNDGNFILIEADEENPDEACKVFGLSCNDYGGWLPQFMISSTRWGIFVADKFENIRKDLLKAFAEKTSAD